MKGPFERLKYDLRRVWECPECHHKERADGTVTTLVCRCQARKKDLQDRVVMKLVEDRIQRRLPLFVPPTSAEETETEIVAQPPEEAGQIDKAGQLDSATKIEETASDESPSEL